MRAHVHTHIHTHMIEKGPLESIYLIKFIFNKYKNENLSKCIVYMDRSSVRDLTMFYVVKIFRRYIYIVKIEQECIAQKNNYIVMFLIFIENSALFTI